MLENVQKVVEGDFVVKNGIHVPGKSEFAKERYGFYTPEPVGWKLLIEVYVRKEGDNALRADGSSSFIVMPNLVSKHDQWRSYVGLVIDMGKSAYKSERYRESGPWCAIGDWVLFVKNEGSKVNYRGLSLQTIPDDAVEGIVLDPTYINID